MATIAHLAMGTPDLRKTRNFYKEVFGLAEGDRKYLRGGDKNWWPEPGENPPDELVRQVYLSDGHMNLTVGIVPVSFRAVGLDHFGFVVDSIGDILDRCQAAGVKQLAQRSTSAQAHFDVPIMGPEGVKIDLAEAGSTKIWPINSSGEARGKIQHIALNTLDVVKSANFYKEVFGLEEVERKYEPGAGHNPPDAMVRRIYLWDGHMNLTLCKASVAGMSHFGFAVDHLDEARERLRVGGAPLVRASSGQSGHKGPEYGNEVKYRGPEGVTIDVSQQGWGP